MSQDREPVGLGVLGCADIAVRRMLPAALDVAEVRLVAVSARDPEKAARVAAAFGCQAEPGYRQLLERPDVEAVYIPLPLALHRPWALAALRRGRHVLVEKPLATSAGLAAEVAAAAAERDLVLMENFMFLHHGRTRVARHLLADGAAGRLRAFGAAFAVPPRPPDDIRYRPELGGGALYDVGVYPLRAAQYFLGDDLEVVGAHLDVGESGVDVGGAVLLRSPQGVTAQLTFGMRHAYQSRYELWGSAGRIVVDRAFTPPAESSTTLRLETEGGVRELLSPSQDQCANMLRHFAGEVRRAAPGRYAPEAQQAVALARLLDEVFRAAGVPIAEPDPHPPGPEPRAGRTLTEDRDDPDDA